MYGTVSEICIALLKQHENNKQIAVITWTPEDVREAGAEYSPTDDDVSYVLRVIGKAGSAGVWRYGLGLEFVADELSKISAARASRQIAVPEDALRVLFAPDGSRNEHSALSDAGHGRRGMRRAGYAQNPAGSAVYAASG